MSKELLIVTYEANNNQPFNFFKELGFSNKSAHRTLEFLCALDHIEENNSKIPAQILFIEAHTSINNGLYNTLVDADNVYLIYTNKTEDALKKLQKIRKGNIHRKVLNIGLEQEMAIEIIASMAKAYNRRDRTEYFDNYKTLLSLFNNNFLQEAQLTIMHASSHYAQVEKILRGHHENNVTDLFINKLLEKPIIKDILIRLSNKDLNNKDAALKVRSQLHKEIFSNLDKVA